MKKTIHISGRILAAAGIFAILILAACPQESGGNPGKGPVTPAATYTLTVPQSIANGQITADKTTGIKAGESVTLTVTPNQGYILSGKPHVDGDEGQSVDPADIGDISVPAEDPVKKFRFDMPDYDVTVTADFIDPNKTVINYPAAEPHGAFTVSLDDGTPVVSGETEIEPGTEIKITVTSVEAGYKFDPPGTGLPALSKVSGKLEWTFEMPSGTVSFGSFFTPLGVLEIFKGGARAGITADIMDDHADPALMETLLDTDFIVNYEAAGHDGNKRVIRMSTAEPGGYKAFSLKSDTPVELLQHKVTALSFWAKLENPDGGDLGRGLMFIGFGDSMKDVDGFYNTQVTYSGEANPQQNDNVMLTAEWRHFIVPVPGEFWDGFGAWGDNRRTWTTVRPFYIAGDVWSAHGAVLIDDIEFLTSGVSVSDITIPDIFANPLIYPLTTDAKTLINKTDIFLTYEHTDGTTATMFHGRTQRPTNFNNWGFPFTYSGSGDITVSPAGLISPNVPGGAGNLYAVLDGKTSNAMALTVTGDFNLTDFDAYNGGIPNGGAPQDGVNIFWHEGTSTTWFAATGTESYNGKRSALFGYNYEGKDNDTKGGEFFTGGPVNLSGFDTVSFMFRTGAPDDVYTFGLNSGATTANPQGGTFYAAEFTVSDTYPAYEENSWVEITIPLADFEDGDGEQVDPSAINGWQLTVKEKVWLENYLPEPDDPNPECRLYITLIKATNK